MKFLIIDGNSILNRAFYGIRVLTNSRGVPTNALTGFTNTLLMLKKDIAPDLVAVSFDLKAPTFRHKRYDGYKANRKGMPDELAAQLPYIKEIIRYMGIAILEKEGYEADDIIGTVSAICKRNDVECFISTGDRDSFQLVNDKVTVRLAKTKGDILYTPEVIFEEYGVTPRQMIEVKALMGDSSDNIPGVQGIGEKTALSLIKDFGSVDGVYENIDSDKIKKAAREKLINGKDMCYLSRELAEICLSAPIDDNLDSYKEKPMEENKLAELLSELEMYSLIKKLGLTPTKPPAISKEAKAKKSSAPEMPMADLVFIDSGRLFCGKAGEVKEVYADKLKDFLENEDTKHLFDLKSTLTALNTERINNVTFDTTLSEYLISPDSNDYSIDRLCIKYGIPMGNTEQERSITIAALNMALYEKLNELDGMRVLTDIEIPLSEVLVAMEKEGIEIDCEGIKKFGEELAE
ncbi:MAG: DNA polymerase I, partial [Ruminiclostridium sp.]|nr:DNA polymerase I [Ruminiclostridium sp.]